MKRICLFFIGLAVLLAALPVHAAMSSANYRITTTVMSSGGGSMTSSSYQLTGTVGQPSPLIDPLDPPFSTSYEMLTGFWYTLGGGGCAYDHDEDGDVDGVDLHDFINAFDPANVPAFADEFGRIGCE